MLFNVDFKSGQAVHLQLTAQIKDALASGALRPGEALPAIGEVARELRINRNHINRAYEELESIGIIERSSAQGYRVKEAHRPLIKGIAREQKTETAAAQRAYFAFTRADFLSTLVALIVAAVPPSMAIGFGIVKGERATLLAALLFCSAALLLQPKIRERFAKTASATPVDPQLLASPDFDSLFAHVTDAAHSLLKRKPVLLRDHSEVLSLVNRFPDLRRLLRPVPFGNDLYLPLASQDEVLAVLHLSRPGTRFSSSEHDSLAALAQDFSRAATQLRARSERAESEYALEIQRGLLPRSIPDVPGFTIAGAWQPAKDVGGDYYDVFRLNDHQLALIVADVSGKGAPAALLMSNLQATTKAYAASDSSPASLTEKINRAICASITAGRFITFFFAVLDTRAHTLTYCNAGHNPPLVVTQSGDRLHLENGGTVLGLFSEAEYEQASISLNPGDRLVIFTDGVLEAADSSEHEFGEDRLFTAMTASANASAHDLRDSIMQAVNRFCGGDFADDATLLTVVVHAANAKAAAV